MLNEAMDLFIQNALKKNACMDVLNHATGQHGFDCRDDNARTRDILRRTIEFIHTWGNGGATKSEPIGETRTGPIANRPAGR
jgi:hypothetical protein